MIDNKKLTDALQELRSQGKRNFEQTFELIVVLRDFDPKKDQVDFYVHLDKPHGVATKVCALAGPEMIDEAKKIFDRAIGQSEFKQLGSDKSAMKKLGSQYDYFVAQANIMSDVAATFGRVLGPRGKMPNPKAGCVVPPKAALKPLYDRLKDTIRVRTRQTTMVQIAIGKENQDDAVVVENIEHVYSSLIHQLPLEENNVKSVFVKMTMTKPIQVQ